MTRYMIAVALLVAAAAVAEDAADAESPDLDPAEVEASAAQRAPAEARTSGDATGGASDEVFIPTEEISEDFAVSFPVDI